MSLPVPRLRVFAGPNGSGKSTIKDVLKPEWLGVYINPDEIEKALRAGFALELADFGVSPERAAGVLSFLRESTLLQKAGLVPEVDRLTIVGSELRFAEVNVNSYWASALSDFVRRELLHSGTSFTFETVMSSPDKIAFLQDAQAQGFRTYLYFVATEDADINVSRVQLRVTQGGHNVPEEKIRSRYERSLALLSQAIAHANRAFVFDNSGEQSVLLAEIVDGIELEMKVDTMPHWFKEAVWDHFVAGGPQAS